MTGLAALEAEAEAEEAAEQAAIERRRAAEEDLRMSGFSDEVMFIYMAAWRVTLRELAVDRGLLDDLALSDSAGDFQQGSDTSVTPKFRAKLADIYRRWIRTGRAYERVERL